jgi:single-strand DNA-binding protein
MADNSLTIIGNMTRDPELRFTQGGKAVCTIGLAVNKRVQVNGEWQDGEATFINVIAWQQLGENAAASFNKGDRVIATGELRVRTWDKEDGTKGTAVELIAGDLGPSLKWASTQAVRNERKAVSANAPASSNQRPPDPVYGDEEPF